MVHRTPNDMPSDLGYVNPVNLRVKHLFLDNNSICPMEQPQHRTDRQWYSGVGGGSGGDGSGGGGDVGGGGGGGISHFVKCCDALLM